MIAAILRVSADHGAGGDAVDGAHDPTAGLVDGQAELHGQLLAAADQHREGVVGVDFEVTEILDELQKYNAAFDDYVSSVENRSEQDKAMVDNARVVLAESESLIKVVMTAIAQANAAAIRLILICALLSVVLGILLAILITRGITGPLGKCMAAADAVAKYDLTDLALQIRDGSMHLASSSEEISASAQQLQRLVEQFKLNEQVKAGKALLQSPAAEPVKRLFSKAKQAEATGVALKKRMNGDAPGPCSERLTNHFFMTIQAVTQPRKICRGGLDVPALFVAATWAIKEVHSLPVGGERWQSTNRSSHPRSKKS